MRRHTGVLFLTIAICTCHGQVNSSHRGSNSKPAITRAQKSSPLHSSQLVDSAQQLTNAILDSDFKLPAEKLALERARLCEAWWRSDVQRARAWCGEAIDRVLVQREGETADEHEKRLLLTRQVLAVVGSLNSAWRERLIGSLVSDSDTRGGNSNIASAIAASAIDAETTPDNAFASVRESLAMAVTSQGLKALALLAPRDPAQADEIFAQTLAQLSQHVTFRDLNSLYESYFIPPGSGFVPPQWYEAVIHLYAQVLAAPVSVTDKVPYCSLVDRMQTEFENRPDVRLVFQQALTVCHPSVKQVNNADAVKVDAKHPATSSDFLNLSGELQDIGLRAQVKMSAAIRTELDEKDPVKALQIIESMSDDELNTRPSAYARVRTDITVAAVRKTVTVLKDEISAMRILDRTPQPILLSVLLNVADVPAPQFSNDVMRRLRTVLVSGAVPNQRDYVRIANVLIVGTQRIEDLRTVFREMNAWSRKPTDKTQDPYFPLVEPETFAPLPFSRKITEVDPSELLAAVDELTNESLKLTAQLTFVKMWLDAAQSRNTVNTEKQHSN